jgi:hypothetical protein
MGTVLSITGNSIPRSNVEFESFLHHYFDVNASYGAEPIYGMSTTSMGEVEHHSDAAGYDLIGYPWSIPRRKILGLFHSRAIINLLMVNQY